MAMKKTRQLETVLDWRKTIWFCCSISCRSKIYLREYPVQGRFVKMIFSLTTPAGRWHLRWNATTNIPSPMARWRDTTYWSSLPSQRIWFSCSAKDYERMTPNGSSSCPNCWVYSFAIRCCMCRMWTKCSGKSLVPLWIWLTRFPRLQKQLFVQRHPTLSAHTNRIRHVRTAGYSTHLQITKPGRMAIPCHPTVCGSLPADHLEALLCVDRGLCRRRHRERHRR